MKYLYLIENNAFPVIKPIYLHLIQCDFYL